MFHRIAAVFAVTLTLTGPLGAQNPIADRSQPVGQNRSDAASVSFEVEFSEPVSGATTSDLIVGGTHTPTATATTFVPDHTSSLELTTTDQRGIASNATLSNGDWTVEFWVFPTAGGARHVYSYATSLSTNAILFNVDGDVWVRGTLETSGPALPLNTWTHVAIVDDFPNVTLYYNGESMGSSISTSPPGSSGTLVIGDDQDSIGGGFDPAQAFLGRVDEIRVWNGPRSITAIRRDLGRQIDPNTSGLRHYWRCDEAVDVGAGAPGANDLEDLAGSAHLDLVNMPGFGVGAASSTWVADIDTSATTTEGLVTVDVSTAGTIIDVDGNALVANPDGTSLAALSYEACLAPVVIAQGQAMPSQDVLPVRKLVFDQFVTGVAESELTLGGAAPGATTMTTSSFFKQALDLPDTTSYAQDLDFPFPETGAMTLECWFRTDDEGEALVSVAHATEDNVFFVFTNGAVRVDDIEVMAPIDVGQEDGAWHHMAITRDSSSVMRRYIDGIPAGHAAMTEGTSNGTKVMILGQDQDSFGGGFEASQALDGAIDEVRIWTIARTATEIADGYTLRFDATTPGLLADYRCDEIVSNELVDETGQNPLTTVGSGAALTAMNYAAEWDVKLANIGGATKFIEIDLDPVNAITNACGLGAVTDASGEPAITHVHIEDVLLSAQRDLDVPVFGRLALAELDTLQLKFWSPNGTHDFVAVPLLAAQMIGAGAEAGSVGVLPELRFNLASPQEPFVAYDGAFTGPFPPSFMTPGGTAFATVVPLGAAGFSMALQCLARNTSAANGFFAVSNLIVLDL